MSSFELIRIEIMKAQDALAEARAGLLRVRYARDTERVVDTLRRAIDSIARAIEGCQRVQGGGA